jgi:hypothetical protein
LNNVFASQKAKKFKRAPAEAPAGVFFRPLADFIPLQETIFEVPVILTIFRKVLEPLNREVNAFSVRPGNRGHRQNSAKVSAGEPIPFYRIPRSGHKGIISM